MAERGPKGEVLVDVSHADKVLFPDTGITKGALVDYYRRIAGTALPHMVGRPLTLRRFPDGIGSSGFFQKNASDHFPDWIERTEVAKEDGTVHHVVADRPETLVYLANQACIEFHGGLSQAESIDRPDRLIFDLDPPDGDFAPVRSAALALRDLFEEAKVSVWLMTTGSTGLHVVVPLDRSTPFDPVRVLAHAVAEQLVDAHPDDLTLEVRKDKRRGRVFVDTLRNAYGQSAVLPYSVRAREGAPVATPLAWDELTPQLRSDSFHIGNVFRRLGQKSDPWDGMTRHAVSAENLGKRLGIEVGD